jgi:2-methylisocitrate lyase-like PEP mutase family enzyme
MIRTERNRASSGMETESMKALAVGPSLNVAKRTASAMKVDVFVNAGTDVYLQNLVPDENKAEETLARPVLYGEAGADGLFVPALTELTQIAQITVGTKLPVNLLAWKVICHHEVNSMSEQKRKLAVNLAQLATIGATLPLVTAFAHGAECQIAPGLETEVIVKEKCMEVIQCQKR